MAELAGEKADRAKPVMGFTVERVNALSDGVFAVAITLLGLSIAVPSITGTVTNSKLAHGLAQVWPHFFAYALSFVIIAMFWISHHSLFSVIRRVDRVLIWINIFYLLLIVFLPYSTNLLSLFGETAVATVLYASVLASTAILQAAMGYYAMRGHRLVDDELDMKYLDEFLRNSLSTAAVFIISIAIAIFNVTVAQFSWMLLFFTPLLELLIFKRKSGKSAAEEPEGI
jgi:uncharacterized membrane protein